MAEYQRPTNESGFEKNFEQIKPLMTATEAYYESSRCLFCYDAPCTKACPTKIDIPLFIRHINTGNLNAAAKTIYQANYFGNICGNVCPTEVLCEGVCVFTEQKIKPIEIGRLQAFAAHHSIQNEKKHFILAENNDKKIAIIGAGPAGISCACELRLAGFSVDIFEAKSLPSGLTIYGVAPYKITNQTVLEEMDYLKNQFDFNVFYNNPIINKGSLKRIESDYDAVFIGIGLGEASEIGIPGEDLKNCLGAVKFIENLKMKHHKTEIGEKVIVLGGGNTAMDSASESARMGTEVVLCYRRSKKEMPAYSFEFDLAKKAGIRTMFNVVPLEIVGKNKVEGVNFIRSKIINGKVNTIAGTEFVESCDVVIRATGQAYQQNFLNLIEGLKVDEKGRIVVNEKSGQTDNPKYFAGGDAVNGGREVVDAVAEGKIAAKGIQQYLVEVDK